MKNKESQRTYYGSEDSKRQRLDVVWILHGIQEVGKGTGKELAQENLHTGL